MLKIVNLPFFIFLDAEQYVKAIKGEKTYSIEILVCKLKFDKINCFSSFSYLRKVI